MTEPKDRAVNPDPEDSGTQHGVRPGDLSPQSAQTTGAIGRKPDVPEAGNRIGVTVILLGVALLAVLFIVWAVVRAANL